MFKVGDIVRSVSSERVGTITHVPKEFEWCMFVDVMWNGATTSTTHTKSCITHHAFNEKVAKPIKFVRMLVKYSEGGEQHFCDPSKSDYEYTIDNNEITIVKKADDSTDSYKRTVAITTTIELDKLAYIKVDGFDIYRKETIVEITTADNITRKLTTRDVKNIKVDGKDVYVK